MTDINHLAEQHIREYEARLKHINELMEQADNAKHAAEDSSAVSAELENLKQEHSSLVEQLEEMKQHSEEEWAEKGGPMVMWDIVADRLEKLVERIKH